ncbi:MAG TPA: zinc ribbon domain-containing protein, partial [Mycobacterium sp.]|nr:zinc ribbon domain-containing protein [Mycobacterium sp.]
SAALMLIPVMLAWRWRLPTRKPLDGFIIGALGAISFTAAGTLTRLAPQFATGQIAHGRPIGGLLVEATIQGVAMPLTAAAAGGLVGTALWFTPRFPWPSRRWLVPVAVVVLIAYAALGITDVSGYPEMVQAAVELVVALLVVLALRIGLHMALLHHAHGPSPGAPLVCPECAKVLPELPFCPDCGVASQPAPLRYTSHARLAAGLAVGLAPVVAAAVVVTWILTPSARVYVCPPDCGEPPTGMPIQTNPRFTAGDGGFSVSYPGKAMFYSSVLENDGVVLDLHAGDGGTLQLMGQPAAARDPRQIAAELIKKTYPDATMDYELPNAMVGYQPGYGEIDDVYPEDVEGTYTRLRVLVLVAVKNGLALIAAAVGPYHEFTPDFGTGSPSGANLELALDIGKYVNSFRWRGDPPR